MHIMKSPSIRQESLQNRTCKGVIPSIMTINCLLILGENAEPMVKVLRVINFVVLQVKEKTNSSSSALLFQMKL